MTSDEYSCPPEFSCPRVRGRASPLPKEEEDYRLPLFPFLRHAAINSHHNRSRDRGTTLRATVGTRGLFREEDQRILLVKKENEE